MIADQRMSIRRLPLPCPPALTQPVRRRAAHVLTVLLTLLLTLAGCSRVTVAYKNADFFVRQYASGYLDLSTAQLARWEPRLDAELARHRAEELPYLAAFFDQLLAASQVGFARERMDCLLDGFKELYRRQARTAVNLAAPLLADLTPAQIDALARKFSEEYTEDQADLAKRDWSWEKRKRTKRYVAAIEDWTGELSPRQRSIVAEVTGGMPDAESAVITYRAHKRDELIALLRNQAGESRIAGFMTAWLVDFSDLPPDLRAAGDSIAEHMNELFVRLGASFDERQRAHLDDRLRHLRDDLMRLQKHPRLAPSSC